MGTMPRISGASNAAATSSMPGSWYPCGLAWLVFLGTASIAADGFVLRSATGRSSGHGRPPSYPTALSMVSGPRLHVNVGIERDGTASTSSTATAPPRKKKHQSRTKPTSKRNRRKALAKGKQLSSSSSGPVSASDVRHHVATQYITGPGGVVRDKVARRDRMETNTQIIKTDPSHKKQMEYLKKLDRHPALVLNADYQPLSLLPLSLWCWQDAVKSIFQGKVTVVDTYPDVFVRAVNLDMPLPSVIALNDYVPKKEQTPAFTRRNVFLRDGYKCQYCHEYFKTNDLTLDHFVPRSMGGRLEWKNAVSCCRKCNGRKGSVHPKKLRSIGMRVLQEPRVPTQWELATMAGKMVPKRVHPTWQPYLGVLAPTDYDDNTVTKVY
mmetsp:Transcript_28323/g.61671  ORF Transcript_28323/g.61671 Transcript_28323/m.61671 type:complete len:381 (+) Transcript_28323:290-1432(+)